MSMVDTLAALHWRWPAAWALLLWPLAATLWAKRRQHRLLAYADAPLRPWAVVEEGSNAGSARRVAVSWLAWALLAAALAGPRLPSAAATGDASGLPPHAVDVMVVIDISASMAETDVAPDRLTRARLELSDLLRRLHGERLGLVVVAGQAGLVLPLTRDAALFEHALSRIGADLLEARGSDAAAGLWLAQQALAKSVRGSRGVLLVTDAERGDLDGEPGRALQQAMQALGKEGVPVFVLAVSTDQPAADAGAVRAPDHQAWHRLAQASGGRLVAAADGDDDVDRLYNDGIAELPGAPVPAERARGWRQLFHAPLLAALALWMGLLLPPLPWRQRAVPALAWGVVVGALATGAIPPDAQAQAESGRAPARALEQQAWAAWQAGQWSRAQALYERLGSADGALAAGAAALRAGDAAAAQRLSARALMLAGTPAMRSDALFNLAHAHARQGRWGTAAEAWQAVLAARPGDVRAAANLAVARAELAREARQRPMGGDLRGRRGFIAEGEVQTDGSTDREAPALGDPGPRRVTDAAAAGVAQFGPHGATADDDAVTVEARHLSSGLIKIGRVGDATTALLKGIVRQDRSGTPRQGLQAW